VKYLGRKKMRLRERGRGSRERGLKADGKREKEDAKTTRTLGGWAKLGCDKEKKKPKNETSVSLEENKKPSPRLTPDT